MINLIKVIILGCILTAINSQNNIFAQAPANDNLADAQPVDPGGEVVLGSSVDATKETGEPDHASKAGGHSVWWSWTPASSGLTAFSTAGSDFDTVIGIYTGDVYPVNLIAENDDENVGEGIYSSRVSFEAVAGTTYKIAVDGFDEVEFGNITLECIVNISRPANDDLADATPISGATGSVTGTNVDASLEPGEAEIIEGGGGRSVWWSWTAPGPGIFIFDTEQSGFDTILGVFEGTGHPLTLVASNDDTVGLASEVSFVATNGSTYHVAVDGYDSSGNVKLSWALSIPKVQSIIRVGTALTNASSRQYTVTFMDNVTGVDASDFLITSNGVTGASVTNVTGSGKVYTVTVNTGTGDGTIRLDVSDDDTILDAGATPLGGVGDNGDFTTGQLFTIDKTAPAVSTIEAVSGQIVDLTYIETNSLGAGVTIPGNYTVTGDGIGTVSANPNTVALLSGKIYRLTWTAGQMVNGQPITVTVTGVQDGAGNAISGSNSASNTALPVTLSGFTLE